MCVGDRVRSCISLAIVLVVSLVAPAPAQYTSPTDPVPPPGAYQQALGPYGSWQTDPGYGQYWQPSVPIGWQPYSDGQWIWTVYGWTWISSEPWSWTFHYGRWAYLPPRGWVWLPGTVWGPAWVSWVSYGGFIGWAPLSPFGPMVFNNFVFVRNADFSAPRIRTAMVRRDLLPAPLLVHWQDHVVRAPERRFIEEVSRHPVRALNDRPVDTLAPWQRTDRGPAAPPAMRPRPADTPLRGIDRPDRDRAQRPWFRPPRGNAPPAVQSPGFDGEQRLPGHRSGPRSAAPVPVAPPVNRGVTGPPAAPAGPGHVASPP
jgi:hypothetical protein